MPPHKILQECVKEFEKLNDGQDQIKVQLFDMEDNHLKHITEKLDSQWETLDVQGKDILSLKISGANHEGRLTLLMWALPLSFAVIGAIIILVDKIWS